MLSSPVGKGTERRLDRHAAGRTQPRETEGIAHMRVMFWTWIVLIGAGLIFYSVVGLSHH
jgi:hypothetical protein